MCTHIMLFKQIKFVVGNICSIFLFCHQHTTQYSMWAEEKGKTTIPKFFSDSPMVNYILMQIYWRSFQSQVKHDWASKIINLWGKSILIWKSGSHSCHFSISEHSSDLKKLFVVLWKKRWKGTYHFGQNAAETIIYNCCTYLKLCTLF